MSISRWLVALGVSALCLARPETSAALPDRVLSRVVPYDLHGERTLGALEELGREELSRDTNERAAARHVRALAYSDLWLLGRLLHNDGVASRVAQALGSEHAALPAVLGALLAPLANEDSTVRDARAALAAGRALPELLGPRTAAVALAQVVSALHTAAPSEPLAALAELTRDPCEAAAKCAPELGALDAPGRRAFAALQRAHDALGIVARHGDDPFAAALAPLVGDAEQSFEKATLYPGRALPDASPALGTDEGEAAFGRARAVVVTVLPERFRLSTSAQIRVARDGTPTLVAPELGFVNALDVPVPTELTPYVKPIPQLSEALTRVLAGCGDCRVLVASGPQTDGHLIARALLSARAAGRDASALLVTGPSARALPIVSVSALDAQKDGARVEQRVQVRRGGFELRRGSTSTSLPRVPGPSGFTFDYAALQKRLGAGTRSPGALAFTSDVSGEVVLNTAQLLARRRSPVTLLLP